MVDKNVPTKYNQCNQFVSDGTSNIMRVALESLR